VTTDTFLLSDTHHDREPPVRSSPYLYTVDDYLAPPLVGPPEVMKWADISPRFPAAERLTRAPPRGNHRIAAGGRLPGTSSRRDPDAVHPPGRHRGFRLAVWHGNYTGTFTADPSVLNTISSAAPASVTVTGLSPGPPDVNQTYATNPIFDNITAPAETELEVEDTIGDTLTMLFAPHYPPQPHPPRQP
jgi:hypothetical protein